MKKTRVIIAALTAGMFFSMANAQDKTSFGIKLNTNLTNVKLSDVDNSGSKFHAGASLAGFTKIYFSDILSLQPELLIGYTEAKVDVPGERMKFKYLNVEVPVYLQANIKAGTGNVILGAGPHIGYGVSVDSKTEKLPECSPEDNKKELDHWYSGGGILAGYEFRSRVSVTAGYQLGFDLGSRHKSSGIKTQTVSLGVGYRF